MPELSAIKAIKNPVIKSKIIEEKEDGIVVGRELVTTVSFDYTGSPAKLSEVLYTLAAGNQVDVTFSSPQSAMTAVIEATKKTRLDKSTGELIPSN